MKKNKLSDFVDMQGFMNSVLKKNNRRKSKTMNSSYVKERLIAELRLIIDRYEDSSASQLQFIDSVQNILRKPMYKEDEQ
tara:strand:- start:309 stop:548 length:240 start_codon:yes stop_codon:yes gene_type:complete